MSTAESPTDWFVYAHHKVEEAQQILTQQMVALRDSRDALTQSVQGSNQEQVLPAMAHLQEAGDQLHLAAGILPAALDNIQTAGRLDLQRRLDGIMTAVPSPDIITSYADSALQGLVAIVANAKQRFGLTADATDAANVSDKATEDAAVEHFGLADIGQVLDHITDVDQTIKSTDDILAGANKVDGVIVPTRPDAAPAAENGTETWKQPELVPRLKTTLYILADHFGVDLKDGQQVQLTDGRVDPNMMRQHSYTLVEAAAIGRTMLVCDEAANASYVFDDNQLHTLGVSREQLMAMRKEELNSLLEHNPGLGQRIVYTNRFTDNMTQALGPPKETAPAPEDGAKTVNVLSHELEVSRRPLLAKIRDMAAHEPRLAALAERLETPGATLTAAEQAIITVKLHEDGWLPDKAPDSVLSYNAMGRAAGVRDTAISEAVSQLGDTLGDVKTYRFGSKRVPGLTDEQQRKVLEYIQAARPAAPAPQGIRSAKALAMRLGVSPSSVQQSADNLGDSLGRADTYRFGTNATATGYDQYQQAQIEQELTARGVLDPQAPPEVRSAYSLGKDLNTSDATVKAAAEALGDRLGEVRNYRFQAKHTVGYSPWQQAMIASYIAQRRSR